MSAKCTVRFESRYAAARGGKVDAVLYARDGRSLNVLTLPKPVSIAQARRAKAALMRGCTELSRKRSPDRASLRGPTEVRELQLFCENDGALYRQQVQPIEKNLEKKIAKGVFDKTKAVKLWGYLADNCARKYAKEHGDGRDWHKMFSTADRREVAKAFNDGFMSERGLSGARRRR